MFVVMLPDIHLFMFKILRNTDADSKHLTSLFQVLQAHIGFLFDKHCNQIRKITKEPFLGAHH